METSFGDWVRRRRKALDLTQNLLARRVGCSVSAIFKIEADDRRPSRQIAELLADHLEIPPDQRALFVNLARKEKVVDTSDDTSASDQVPLLSPAYLPLSHKPLVGRDFEMAEINRLLKQPECRLLTLIGPGGIGKTHLARVLADTLAAASKKRPVAFVNLAPLNNREQTVSAIATALGIVLYTASDRADQLISYLQNRNQLLILDNFEHLTEETGCVDLISAVLHRTHNVKIIVTSRQPLQLQAEWVFEVQGLPVPEGDDPSTLASNSAEALFIQRAQQAEVGFRPTSEDLRAISQICMLVDGLPLGIELAAGWVHALSCQGIAEEIQRSIHFLESTALDLPERHRSIRATIEYSWRRLSEEEQSVLRELSIFRGGFRRQAAEEITGASLPILSALISKSLIRRVEAGRYDLHGLIQQYALERLHEQGDAGQIVWQKYSRYYANLLAERGQALKGMQRSAVVEELITELPNLRQAWEWASIHQQANDINQAADTLFWLYESRSNCREGVQLFNEPIKHFQKYTESPNDPASELALAQALMYKGYFLFRQGQHPQSREAISNSLQLLHTSIDPNKQDRLMAVSNGTVFLGIVTSMMGDFEEGDRLLQEGLSLKQRLNDLWGAAFCLRQIGIFAFHYRGDFDRAYHALDQSLMISKQMDNTWSTAASLSQLGLIAYAHGDCKQAEQFLTEALELSRTLDDRASIALSLDCLGLVKTAQGQFEEGIELLKDSISLWREIGEKGSLAQTLNHLGSTFLKRRDLSEAQKHFQEAIHIARDMQTIPLLLDALLGQAEVLAMNDRIEISYEIIHAVALNPSTSFETKARAETLKNALEKQLAPHQVQMIQSKTGLTATESLVQTVMGARQVPAKS